MAENIKLLFFIKIFAFILLIWTCQFKKNMSTFSKSLDENRNLFIKLDTRNYRSLANYKQKIDSNNVCLKENFTNNGVKEKKVNGKNKQSNSALNKMRYYTEVIDYNNGMFDGKYFHFEKKRIKKKDYDNFLEKNKRICDITLGKIKLRSYGFVVAIFFFFVLLGIGMPALHVLNPFNVETKDMQGLWKTLNVTIEKWIKGIEIQVYVALYSVLMIMLSVILIIVFYKILRNNEKYKKIKLITEYNE
ncbi:fam-m protein [Plasmodium malariae]|uniref:Fam-m protein n=1 Tax=Plasmodium malariae TaxID=5858 RepID=A0A1D3RJN5_PLAMA|nr:fam-m protein [Plasmodium malariae]SCN45348.1 fam-m protein [Plasmodium malariae]